MADLKLSPSYFVDVIRNDHFEQVTKEKGQSWNGRKIGGRDETIDSYFVTWDNFVLMVKLHLLEHMRVVRRIFLRYVVPQC